MIYADPVPVSSEGGSMSRCAIRFSSTAVSPPSRQMSKCPSAGHLHVDGAGQNRERETDEVAGMTRCARIGSRVPLRPKPTGATGVLNHHLPFAGNINRRPLFSPPASRRDCPLPRSLDFTRARGRGVSSFPSSDPSASALPSPSLFARPFVGVWPDRQHPRHDQGHL